MGNKSSNKVKTPGRQKISVLFLVLSIISTIVMTLYSLFIPASAAFGVFLYILWLFVALFITVFTLGLGWTNPNVVNFSQGFRNFADTVFSKPIETFKVIQPYFPIIVTVTASFVLISLIFSIIWNIKPLENETKNKSRMIASIVFAAIYTVSLIASIFVGYFASIS